MRTIISKLCVIALAALLLASVVLAQAGKRQRNDAPKADKKPSEEQDAGTIKIDTDLITVPVIASDRNDVYVPDLKREEFTLWEDGVQQEITFFATVKEPFHVVLMLDTSASTQEKLGQIQQAAKAFVQQLQTADRVKLISFDDAIRDLSEFTSDRAVLNKAIEQTRPGQGTKLYDAMKLALNNLTRVKGRKAIVLFTDGVDWTSDTTHADENIRQIEESGVLLYPIRYNTRLETEELVRRQQEQGEVVSVGTIFGGGGGNRPPIGTTPPTTGGGSPVPSRTPGSANDPYRLPVPPVVIGPRYPDRGPRGRYPDDRYPDDRYPDNRSPGGGRYPDDRYPDSRYPDSRSPGGGRYPDDRFPDSRNPDPRYPGPSSRRRSDDNISVMLDGLYRRAAAYLDELASASGGKLHYAEHLGALPEAFARIAEELRNQYSLGYYPTNAQRDGKYHKIQVKVNRKNVVIRARPGYRTPRG